VSQPFPRQGSVFDPPGQKVFVHVALHHELMLRAFKTEYKKMSSQKGDVMYSAPKNVSNVLDILIVLHVSH